jgi:Protein of unknown function (DUF 659)/hAT family C-terminal dimerisation region
MADSSAPKPSSKPHLVFVRKWIKVDLEHGGNKCYWLMTEEKVCGHRWKEGSSETHHIEHLWFQHSGAKKEIMKLKPGYSPPERKKPAQPSRKRKLEDDHLVQSHLSFASAATIDLPAALADGFAVLSMPRWWIEHPAFVRILDSYRAATCSLPSRYTLGKHIATRADDVQEAVLRILKEQSRTSPVTLAHDGWTDCNGHKVVNVMLICNGISYFWKSITNTTSANTAAYLAGELGKMIEDLVADGVVVVGVVADNESTNGAVGNLLTARFPYLIDVGCAAHVIQLVAREVLEDDEKVSGLIKQLRAMLAIYSSKKEKRQELDRDQQSLWPERVAVKLLAICITRWASELYAAERVQYLKPVIRYRIAPADDDSDFWIDLDRLVKFLTPLRIATDAVQRDASNLLDLYRQFKMLLRTALMYQSTDPFYHSAQTMIGAIFARWSKYVNESAVICTAQLSCVSDDIDVQFEDDVVADAEDWLLGFAAHYLTAYRFLLKPTNRNKTATEIRSLLLHSFSQFKGRQPPFNQIGQHFDSLRSTAADQKTEFDPRSVWFLYTDKAPEMSYVALALLSVNASEACVERSFSAQGFVHSDVRNRLGPKEVENELIIKLNSELITESSILRSTRTRKHVELDDQFVLAELDRINGLFKDDFGSTPPASSSAASSSLSSAAAAQLVQSSAQSSVFSDVVLTAAMSAGSMRAAEFNRGRAQERSAAATEARVSDCDMEQKYERLLDVPMQEDSRNSRAANENSRSSPANAMSKPPTRPGFSYTKVSVAQSRKELATLFVEDRKKALNVQVLLREPYNRSDWENLLQSWLDKNEDRTHIRDFVKAVKEVMESQGQHPSLLSSSSNPTVVKADIVR